MDWTDSKLNNKSQQIEIMEFWLKDTPPTVVVGSEFQVAAEAAILLYYANCIVNSCQSKSLITR